MSRLTEAVLAGSLLLVVLTASAQERYPGIGRLATPQEIAAWDIDVRPDFKGLPAGSGTVAQGMAVWDARCASCHGSFGESNAVFAPIIGGTTQDDIRTGHVAALRDNSQPQRTTLMKLAQVSTLWDYINRAMPWAAPRSLTTDEVYAVTAYILHMAEVVPQDFILSNRNIGQVQQRLPNRHGMSVVHGMHDVGGTPDVNNAACMKNCSAAGRPASALPDHARNMHGNQVRQNRLVGPVRGIEAVRAQP